MVGLRVLYAFVAFFVLAVCPAGAQLDDLDGLQGFNIGIHAPNVSDATTLPGQNICE
jgi:hypothetical protein